MNLTFQDITAIACTVAGRPASQMVILAQGDSPAGTLVVRFGDRVVKIHPQATDLAGLRTRLAVAEAHPDLFLRPLDGPGRVRSRVVTVWPYRGTIDPDQPEAVPWACAAGLLARLHRVPPPDPCPPQGMPASVADALERLGGTSDAALADAGVAAWARSAVDSAAAGLPLWTTDPCAMPAPGRPSMLVHGDFHLGQLVRSGPQWRLLDVDAMGAGDPIWDLARPAMWLLAGVIDPGDWQVFIDTYQTAGGPAVPPGDPWPTLEPVARAAAVQAAASALARAARLGSPPDEVAGAFVAACRRIAG